MSSSILGKSLVALGSFLKPIAIEALKEAGKLTVQIVASAAADKVGSTVAKKLDTSIPASPSKSNDLLKNAVVSATKIAVQVAVSKSAHSAAGKIDGAYQKGKAVKALNILEQQIKQNDIARQAAINAEEAKKAIVQKALADLVKGREEK